MKRTKLSPSFFGIILLLSVFASSSYAQSIELDKQLGADGAKHIASEMGIYTHTITRAYISDVGARLAENLTPGLFEHQFEIVDMSQPNAFALPGGYIYISRGLLCLVNSEDELAGILGHEMGHAELRHSVKQMQRRILPGLLQIPGEIVGVVVNEDLGKLINTPLKAGSKLFLASYSRKHEKQADKFGTRLMAVSGYNPSHFPAVLHKLSVLVEAITGQEEDFTYFDSHPYTPDRVKYLNKEVAKLDHSATTGITSGQDEFLKMLDGICVGDNPAHGIFKENRFLHPGLGLFVSFPQGWITDNQPTMVGALDTSDNQSMVVLGIAEDEEPETLGIKFSENLRDNYSVIPERSEKVNLNGMPAYLVSLKDSTSGEVFGIHSLWFRFNEVTYQMLGLAQATKTELLRNTAFSVRTLTPEERNSIDIHTLRIREASAGESIEDFNNRTGNVWDAQITAIMNDIKPGTTLSEGQLLKVALKEDYVE